jgi:RNA polymerase sigma factor (sigma-70 family)
MSTDDLGGATLGGPDRVEHFFRHEYGRVVAVLARRVGVRHLEHVEDAVQAALATALTTWTTSGQPDDPGAWVYRVAHNHLIGALRARDTRERALHRRMPANAAVVQELSEPQFDTELADDLLRMLFVCCDESIPRESRLALALKTLCGFDTAEIALRLFISEGNVYKRLGRARARLRAAPLDTGTPSLETLRARIASVHQVLYLLFNEGYLSMRAQQAIRRELCDEAIRLTTLLAEHPVGATPATCALLAMMHLHAARLAARHNAAGDLLLLEEQDRTQWDQRQLLQGAMWLQRSATGDAFTRYHAEAAIAAEHAFALSFEATNWPEICRLYGVLERVAPSPLLTMNRAIATAEWRGAEAGLASLVDLNPPEWLAQSYQWHATLSDLHRRAGHLDVARHHAAAALAAAPGSVTDLLRRRLRFDTLPSQRAAYRGRGRT